MNSTINDIVQANWLCPNSGLFLEKIFTCSCGCKTKNIKKHKKSIRHKYMQRKVDLVNTVQIDNNDDIILNDFLIYKPLKKKTKKMKVSVNVYIHDISCVIDFD